ncbi:MAG: FHA domain-containing protein [Candidatus Aureabacteria bacterium]|nr:FHA domain-containing protein [Candidatus Auribacterota bacterium]
MTEQAIPVLRLNKPDLNGKKTFILDKEITIGRDKKNTIVILSPNVSRHHAKIYKTDKGYYMEDLQSHNGTLLNGRLARKELLQEGDLINIADVEMNFLLSSDTVPDESKVQMTDSQVGPIVSGKTEFVDLSELNKEQMEELRKQKPVRTNPWKES